MILGFSIIAAGFFLLCLGLHMRHNDLRAQRSKQPPNVTSKYLATVDELVDALRESLEYNEDLSARVEELRAENDTLLGDRDALVNELRRVSQREGLIKAALKRSEDARHYKIHPHTVRRWEQGS